MTSHTVDDHEESTGFGGAILAALRRCVGTRPRRALVAITLLLGPVGRPGDDRGSAPPAT